MQLENDKLTPVAKMMKVRLMPKDKYDFIYNLSSAAYDATQKLSPTHASSNAGKERNSQPGLNDNTAKGA